MRTKIDALSDNRCSIEFDNEYGERERYSFYAPRGGGYVRLAGTGNQMCEGFSRRGPTMLWSKLSYPTLADYIRAEYRAMRAKERRRQY